MTLYWVDAAELTRKITGNFALDLSDVGSFAFVLRSPEFAAVGDYRRVLNECGVRRHVA